MTRKTTVFEEWSWFKVNKLGVVLGIALNLYTSVEKGLKLKARKFDGLIATFVEVRGIKTCQKLSAGEDWRCVKYVQIRSFFWSVFSGIRTEYGDIRSISPYLVRMWENTDQKKLRIEHFSRSVDAEIFEWSTILIILRKSTGCKFCENFDKTLNKIQQNSWERHFYRVLQHHEKNDKFVLYYAIFIFGS